MRKKLKVREITIAGGLAAFSAVAQLLHFGYQSPQFGMWIDIVAVTWIIALFLFDLRMSLVVSIIGAIIITLFAPETWLGASMKWLATVPTILVFGIWIIKRGNPLKYYQKPSRLLLPLLIALLIRCLIIIPVNYFYAIPIWTGIPWQKAMIVIPWYIIAIFNVIQGILEVFLAWLLVFKFRLDRFAAKKI
jgi:riboflavin transporter FmnP